MGRRSLFLILVTGTLALGLAATRPGPTPAAAQVAGPVEIRCVGFEAGDGRKAIVRIHNATDEAVMAELTWFRAGGDDRETFARGIAPSGTVLELRIDNNIGAAARVTSAGGRLVVDAEMVYDDDGDELSRRTVTCAPIP